MNSTGNHLHSNPCQAWQDYGDSTFTRTLDYAGVLALQDNTWLSILKMDERSGHSPDMNLLMFKQALEQTWGKLQFCLRTRINYFPTINNKSSPTFPYALLGYRSKGEVMAEADFYKIVWDPIKRICWWRVSTKHEYRSIEDILDLKIRTYIIPPLELLFWQKAFGAADEKIKKMQPGDIRYGISFQFGGFNRMIRTGHGDPEDKIWYTLDVSGWDRLVSLMEECWKLRERGLDIPPTIRPIFDWMIANTISSFLLLPNGDVVWKYWGNNSGSGTTTGDNCIMHQIISEYTKLYVESLNIAALEEHLAHLFGDDNLANFIHHWRKNEILEKCEHFKDLLRFVYRLFGLTVKEAAVEVQLGPQGLKFLGGCCRKVGDFYVPSYDSARIYCALTTEIDGHDFDANVSKCYALMHLSWYDDQLFDQIYNCLLRMMSDQDVDSPFLGMIRRSGLPSQHAVIHHFWCGAESGYPYCTPTLFDSTLHYGFSSGMEEEGFKISEEVLTPNTRIYYE